MSTNAKNRYYNVYNVSDGTNVYSTVKSVGFDIKLRELRDGGDNDMYESFGAVTAGSVDVNVDIADPVQAQSLLAAGTIASFSFKGTAQAGGTAVAVTVSNVTFSGLSGGGRYGDIWTQRLKGMAVNPAGTNPVSIAATG